jgi:hypothetical protein
MIKDAYPYFPIGDNLFYGFWSEGVKGRILKVIVFTFERRKRKWNLAFGDWKNSGLDDKVVTNNQDVVKVIGTVAKVTYQFFDDYPNAVLVIDPVDEKRKKLYNIVFQRHFETIKKEFKIIGFIGDKRRIYSPMKMYDSFELSLKSKLRK